MQIPKLTTSLFVERMARYKVEHAEQLLTEQLKLKEVFEDYLQDEKLVLETISFSALSSQIQGLNFENCILIDCDFSLCEITNCDFANAELINPQLQASYVYYCDNLPPAIPSMETKEDFEHAHERTLAWLNYHCKVTGLVFEYDLLSHWERLGLVSHVGNFYNFPIYSHFFYEQNELKSSLLGWKLHLSVNFAQVKQALRLVGPLLAFSHTFKVIDYDHFLDIKHVSDERFNLGEQITVYLEINHQPMPMEEVRELILMITKVFRENSILPGEIPESDAITFSEYCSIRNDFLHFDGYYPNEVLNFIDIPKGLSGSYIYAAPGTHYNYTNRSNPYANLLVLKPDLPIPAYHCAFLSTLNDQELLSAEEKPVYIVGALTAFLEENSLIPSLSSREYEKCLLYALNHDGIPKSLVKEDYQKVGGIAKDLKSALLIIDFFVNGCEGNLNKMNCSFSRFIHPEGSFSLLLAVIDEALSIHPSQKQDNFTDYFLERESQLNGRVYSLYPSFFETSQGFFSTMIDSIEENEKEKEPEKKKDGHP